MRPFRRKPLNPDKRFPVFCVYAVLSTAIWGYVLFPADAIKTALENRIQAWNTEIRIRIGSLSPTLWPGIHMTDIQVLSAEKKWMDWKDLTIRLTGFSLADRAMNWGISGRDSTGHIDGKWTAQSGFSAVPGRFDITLSNFLPDKIPAIQERLNRQISGVLSADIQGRIDGKALAATARVSLIDGKIGIDIPEMTLKQIMFQRIDAHIDATRDAFRLVQCTFSGPHLSGDMSGDMTAKKQMAQSQIELNGKTRIHHPLMAGFRFPTIANMLTTRYPDGVPFRLTGTLAKPSLKLGP